MYNKLIKYLPDFLQDIQEFKIITNISETFIQDLYSNLENILKDLYILEATQDGVRRYEKILNLSPKLTESLEDRRFKIFCKYNEKLPYTYKNLISVLDSICGEGKYKINLSNQNLTLDLKVYLDKRNVLDTIRETLENIVPMNIYISVDLLYNTWNNFENTTWETIRENSWEQIKEEIL